MGVPQMPAVRSAPGAPLPVEAILGHAVVVSKAAAQMRSAAGEALSLLASGGALRSPPAAIGAVPTQDFVELLAALEAAPPLFLRCAGDPCSGYRLARWRLNSERGSVDVVIRPSSATNPGWEGEPFLDRANAGKGAVHLGAGGGDGRATHDYRCRGCGRNISLRAETRLKLYLGAIAAGRREVWA